MITEPAKVARHAGNTLNRQDIVDAAVDLAREESTGWINMAQLAKRLGVGLTSIYWHYHRKEELLDAMTERVCHERSLPVLALEVGRWAESLSSYADDLRDAFRADPILIDLILVRGKIGVAADREWRRSTQRAIAVMVDGGLSGAIADRTLAAVLQHVRQLIVLERLQTIARKGDSAGMEGEPAGLGRFLSTVGDNEFHFGLRAILDHSKGPAQTPR